MSGAKVYAFGVIWAGICAGCGPVLFVNDVTKHAGPAILEAEAVGAAEFAPYEYWGAKAYLDQARILMAYSEYERALDYSKRAHQLAQEAILEASQSRGSLADQQVSDPCAEFEGPRITILAREIACNARKGKELPPE